MFKIILFIIILFNSIFLYSCNSNKENQAPENVSDPSVLYKSAKQKFDEKKLTEAREKFDEVIFLFPLSNEAIQSKIMLGFIDYLKLDYINAIYKFNKLINSYPSHKNIDYVYYMRAICYFEQITNESLDGTNNTDALNKFDELINRFPDSEYVQDSVQKIIIIKENIAAKHMDVGMYYLKDKKYIAAMNRFNTVVKDYSESKFTPEALYRLVEIYYAIGLIEDAKKTTALIGYNYPKSIWYQNAYNIVTKSDKKDGFINKIFNVIKNEKKD
tara:strand:+ start:408 stop:1223 length:816 start_codon:yes stop_codon:yes gene_type:complete